MNDDPLEGQGTSGAGAEGAGGGEGGAGEGGAAAPQVVKFDPESIKALVSSLPQPPAPVAQPAQPERKMTQEELDKAMNVFRATPEHMKRLGLAPEAVNDFNEIITAVVRQALTMSMLAHKHELQTSLEPITSKLMPLERFVNEANERKVREEFFAANEDLKEYETLVEAVYAKLSNSGTRFASKEEAFKTVAEQTRQLMAKAKLLPPGQGEGNNGGSGNAGQPPKKMPQVSTGGRGGAAPTSSSPTVDKEAKSMWG